MIDPDEDGRANALDGLKSHVWHQGDIFDVTPFVVPFVAGVVNDADAPARGETAHFLALVAESARRYSRSEEAEERSLAIRTLHALLSERESIERWWRDDDPAVVDESTTLAWLLEPLHDALADYIRQLSNVRASQLTALALMNGTRAEPWAVELAVRVVRDAGIAQEPRVAAALLLQLAEAPMDDSLGPVIDALTAPVQRALLPDLFDVPPFDFPSRPSAEPLEATVVFSGSNLVLARSADGRQFTIRWPSSGLQKGDAIALARVTTGGIARRAEIPSSDGGVRSMTFDARGLPEA